jgi:hypothetical protein
MTNLSEQEQKQLDALLAKKEAAAKRAKELEKHIDAVKYQISSHAAEVKKALSLDTARLNIFGQLDPKLVELEEEAKNFTRTLFPSYRDIPEEVKGEVLTALERDPEEEVLVARPTLHKIKVKGIPNLYINIDLRIEGGSRWSRAGGKEVVGMQFSNQYDNRYVKLPSTMNQKIKEKVAKMEREAAVAKAKKSEKEQALQAAMDMFSNASNVVAEKVWKSGGSYGRRREGYSFNTINVEFEDGSVFKFTYRTIDDKIKLDLYDAGFNVERAVVAKAGNLKDAVADFRELRKALKK